MILSSCDVRLILFCLWSTTLLINVSRSSEIVNKQEVSVQSSSAPIKRNETEKSKGEKEDSKGLDEAASSPSITSVHQVWTSTSSGRLDELSPEMIGKLRNDVPFLAAYALRPRLVGAITSNPSGAIKPLDSYMNQVSPDSPLVQQASDSNERRVSLVPKLGDFSEFKVETSSTSKSEHHHKRRTSLKRKPKREEAGLINDELSRKKRVIQQANSLLKKRRDVKLGSSKGTKSNGNLLETQKLDSNQMKRKLDNGNLLRHMSIIRHGRYIQMSDDEEENDDLAAARNKVEKKAKDESSGTKGGGQRFSERPFYGFRSTNNSTTRDSLKPSVAEKSLETNGPNDIEIESLGKKQDRDNKPSDEAQVEPDEEETEEEALEPPSTTKRVGEDDVEEDGDTVTVTPKSDGVEHDPELPDYEADSPDGERGKRIGREKSHKLESKDEDENEYESDAKRINNEELNKNGSALGGGLGATTSYGNEKKGPDEDSTGAAVTPGVELADDADGNLSGTDEKRHDTTLKKGARKDDTVEEDDTDDIYDRKETSKNREKFPSRETLVNEDLDMKREPKKFKGSTSIGDAKSTSLSSREDDVEYDDEDDQQVNGKRRKPSSRGHSIDRIEEDEETDVDYRDVIEGTNMNEKRKKASSSTSKERKFKKKMESIKHSDHCNEDESYEHGDEHHHHHHHHNSIKWLEDAIPGTPGFDYPTVSKINVTSFNCRDHKYPGYYADVEYRCQVFHICQADGRQDSFLCPNGTIFSQKTTVCVWWNSFDCEDAPKYYDLNALLYKTPVMYDGKQIMTELRPHDQADRESTLDSLLRSMSPQSNNGMKVAINNNFAEDGSMEDKTNFQKARASTNHDTEDGTTMQRKSIALIEDYSSGLNESARSARSRRTNAGPRRKRRASARQAPPKLKSRRIIKNSRRWKLRHNLKPKRRA